MHLLVQLHEEYGEVVRVGPNQVCFPPHLYYLDEMSTRKQADIDSSISRPQKHTTQFTMPMLDGTKSACCMSLLEKTIRVSG